MAGLSKFISNEATQSTSMPTWFDAAQQDVVKNATAATIPTLANTSAGAAIKQFDVGGTNPFAQAQGTLNTIASGAANPWLVSDTGQVTPNTSTAMGGLFQAQNQALEQLMPQYTAPVEGANIASGQFGSLRGQTAVNKAMTDAQSKLFADQMQAALQAQGVGAQAASALGQVGSQGVETMTKLGQAEQSDPLFGSSAVSKILGSMQIPTTTKNVTNLSPLNQIGSIVSAMGGSISGTDKLLKDLGLGGLSKYISGAGSGSYAGSGLGAGLGAGTYTLADGGTMTIGADGYRTINNIDGTSQTFDKDGTLLNSGRTDQYSDTDIDLGGGSGDTGGNTGGGFNFDWNTYEPSNPYEGYNNIENYEP